MNTGLKVGMCLKTISQHHKWVAGTTGYKSSTSELNFKPFQMKIATQPTDCILVKANSNSDWDPCNFIIVDISKAWQLLISKRLTMLEAFKEDNSFDSLVYWDAPIDFFIHSPGDHEALDQFLNDDHLDWVFVDLEQHHIDGLSTPESTLNAHQLVITSHCTAYYKAYGKHTGEEYWSVAINIPDLLKIINS